MSDFFTMDGYGGYVWAAFGFATVVLIALLVQSIAVARRRERELERLRVAAAPARGAPAPARRVARRPADRPTAAVPGMRE